MSRLTARSGAAPFFFVAADEGSSLCGVLKIYPETVGVSLEAMERHPARATPKT